MFMNQSASADSLEESLSSLQAFAGRPRSHEQLLEPNPRFVKETARKMSRPPPTGETTNSIRRHGTGAAQLCSASRSRRRVTTAGEAGGTGSAAKPVRPVAMCGRE